MKKSIDRILLIILLCVIAGGIFYATKVFIAFFNDSDSELISVIDNTGEIDASIIGISDCVRDSGRKLDTIGVSTKRSRESADRIAQSTENIKQQLEGIRDTTKRAKAAIDRCWKAKRELDFCISELSKRSEERSIENGKKIESISDINNLIRSDDNY